MNQKKWGFQCREKFGELKELTIWVTLLVTRLMNHKCRSNATSNGIASRLSLKCSILMVLATNNNFWVETQCSFNDGVIETCVAGMIKTWGLNKEEHNSCPCLNTLAYLSDMMLKFVSGLYPIHFLRICEAMRIGSASVSVGTVQPLVHHLLVCK